MNWMFLQNGAIVLLLACWVTSAALNSENASDELVPSNATSINVSMPEPVLLDSKLRTALLKALSDLENESSDDNEERDVEKAHASAITIVEDDLSSAPPPSLTETKRENVPKTEPPDTSNPSGEPSNEKAQSILFQKSHSLQSSITTIEQSPLDPLKDAENIITSASNSFGSEGQTEPRSIPKEPQQQVDLDISLNSIYTSEPTNSERVTSVNKVSDEKAVDEPLFLRTYVKPLEQEASSENGNTNKELDKATEKPLEVSTEENEAKVEQVQFFSAPLVAAFTVHQDETGHPKKVEPIYKNDNNAQQLMQQINSVELSPVSSRNSFNSLSLQQKQQLLEQELQQLRVQQQQLFARNNFAAGSQVLSQSGFNQAINQNFNQLDPVFTEPDRSIVTKLASIDPNNLLAQVADPFFSKFMPNEAIVPVASPTSSGDVSFTSSISFDPLVEAGKLPKNAQVLPIKEPTGFHNVQTFLQPNQQQVNGNYLAQTENQNRILRQEQGTANLGFNQNSFSIVPAQQPVPPKHELGYFPEYNRFPVPQGLHHQNTRLLRNSAQENRGGSFQSAPQSLSIQLFGSNSQIPSGNRFLNSNQNSVRVLEQPHRFAQNNRILRSNIDSNFIFQSPVLQNYKYSRPFGFSTLRLH